MRLGKKRHSLRKLVRPPRPPARTPEGPKTPAHVPSTSELGGVPLEFSSGDSTLLEGEMVAEPVEMPAAKPSKAKSPAASQSDTVETLAIRPTRVDPNEETEGALDGDLKEAEPPDKISFTCACGAKLLATRKTYDKRTRCANCRTLLLISLVWNAGKGDYEIIPFRVGDMPELEV
jgi:hypothetical protein